MRRWNSCHHWDGASWFGRVALLTRRLHKQSRVGRLVGRNPLWTARAGIVSVAHPNAVECAGLLAQRRIRVEERAGLVRASTHFYNTDGDVDRFVEALAITRGVIIAARSGHSTRPWQTSPEDGLPPRPREAVPSSPGASLVIATSTRHRLSPRTSVERSRRASASRGRRTGCRSTDAARVARSSASRSPQSA